MIHQFGGDDAPPRPARPARSKRPAPAAPQRGRRAMLRELTEDPRYLAVKEQLGEPLTSGERARLDAARASGELPGPASARPIPASARPIPASARPGEGEP